MADICDAILDQHHEQRKAYAQLDEHRHSDDIELLRNLWEPLASLLEVHADAEEELFYPRLLRRGDNGEDETLDAVGDHNDIRDGIRRAKDAAVGSDEWWSGVLAAREANSKHMAEEEREALPDFRINVDRDEREKLGAAFTSWMAARIEAQPAGDPDKDPEQYVAEHTS